MAVINLRSSSGVSRFAATVTSGWLRLFMARLLHPRALVRRKRLRSLEVDHFEYSTKLSSIPASAR